jgi:hypothetical protein
MLEHDISTKCFMANRQMTDSEKNPLQWNLYNGLEHLALLVERLHDRIDGIEKLCKQLRQER